MELLTKLFLQLADGVVFQTGILQFHPKIQPLPVVCFGSCDPCVTVTYVDVTFRVDMSEQTVAPEGVHIAGGFQGWNPGGL